MTEYLLLGLSVLFAVIGWLLARKDAAQQAELVTMRVWREADLKVIQTLSLQLASALETLLQAQRDTQKLFDLHDRDAAALADLRLKLASEHYHKVELDNRFEKLDVTIREGFKDFGERFDNLTTALIRNNSHE